MKRVVIESPLGAATREGIEENKLYAKEAVIDCLRRNEAPYASHLFFDQPGILDDMLPDQRDLGIKAGFAWGEAAEAVIFYVDRGISRGMVAGFERAMKTDADILVRSLETGEELFVPIDIAFPGSAQIEEATNRKNLANLIQAAEAVSGNVVLPNASYAPAPTPQMSQEPPSTSGPGPLDTVATGLEQSSGSADE